MLFERSARHRSSSPRYRFQFQPNLSPEPTCRQEKSTKGKYTFLQLGEEKKILSTFPSSSHPLVFSNPISFPLGNTHIRQPLDSFMHPSQELYMIELYGIYILVSISIERTRRETVKRLSSPYLLPSLEISPSRSQKSSNDDRLRHGKGHVFIANISSFNLFTFLLPSYLDLFDPLLRNLEKETRAL